MYPQPENSKMRHPNKGMYPRFCCSFSLPERSQEFRDNAVTTRAGLCAHIPKPTSSVARGKPCPQFSCLRLSLKIRGTPHPAHGLVRAIVVVVVVENLTTQKTLSVLEPSSHLTISDCGVPVHPSPPRSSPSTRRPDDIFKIEPRSGTPRPRPLR